MYGDVDKIKIGKTLFPSWRHILSQNQQQLLTVEKFHSSTAVGIIVVHLVIEFR